MAFRSGKRKDVKKQSYYVWFLGAKESKGLRGEEYIRPVLHYLLDKEKELEPMKVTLQVSNKGLKIIQNVPRKNNRGKTEQIKHFIPHHAITCALQESKPDDDIVCCILLIYNPLTKCPVHVHAYRCDSVETATTLRTQLQILIDRAENQKKFREIENRLAAKGLLLSRRLNSDGRSTRTDGSDRTEDSFGSERDAPVSNRRDQQIASLYDSLAAELRERLGNPNNCPILLPPKDYDTISRKRGRLEGIDQRRSTNLNLVGLTPVNPTPSKSESRHRESGSSGKSSSGIGSDEALSSAIQEVSSHFQSKAIDPDTSSDEEDWPASEAVPDDDEIIQSEWRRAPPRGAAQRYRSSPPSTPKPAPAPVPPTYTYGCRESASLEDNMKGLSLKVNQPPDSYQHGKPRNGYDDYDQMRIREREVEVVYRRRSNPLERKPSRELRPVSYPNPQTPENYRPPPPPDSRPYSREGYLKERREPTSYEPRSFQSQDQHPVARRNPPPEAYQDRRRSEYYPPQERVHQYHPHSDDRRKSAYFDLPVDSRDYRHSFAEPVHRRVPLGAHY